MKHHNLFDKKDAIQSNSSQQKFADIKSEKMSKEEVKRRLAQREMEYLMFLEDDD